jgi:CheY-like chemotaxis protein
MSRLLLLVDDETRPMAYYVRALEQRGFSVKHCLEPDSAISFAREKGREICAIVLDIMMPPGRAYQNEDTHQGLTTGVFLFDDLRRNCPDAPVLVLTNVRNPKTLDEFKGKGNVKVVQKMECPPFEFTELVKTMIKDDQASSRP